MKAINIEWELSETVTEKEKLILPKEVNIPAEIFFLPRADTSAPLSESVDTNEYGEYSMNDRVDDYLRAKYHFNTVSFSIENGECTEILDTLNRVLDNEVDVYGAVHVIQSLLDTGVEPSTIINDFKFDEEDVLTELKERELEEENGLE